MQRLDDSVGSSGFDDLLHELEFVTASVHGAKDGRPMDSLSMSLQQQGAHLASVQRVDCASQSPDDEAQRQRIENIERGGLNVHSPVSRFATAEPEDFQLEHSSSMDLLEEAVLKEAESPKVPLKTQVSPPLRNLHATTAHTFMFDHYEDSVLESASGHHFGKRESSLQGQSIDAMLQEIAEETYGDDDEFALEAKLGVGGDYSPEERRDVNLVASDGTRTGKKRCMIM